MNEVQVEEEGMKRTKVKKKAVAQEEVVVPFLSNYCFVAPQQQPTANRSTLAGHREAQWREAESEAAPKWQQSIRRFCGREMTLTLAENNSILTNLHRSGHVNLSFLGAVGQQQQQRQQTVNLGNSSSNNSSIHHRSKRIRTTFGRSQLDTLRECFKRSHKPNSAQLCSLVHRTGLSKRVIQVWFQNQRSKWLRHMFERYSSGSSSKTAAAAGASSIGPHIVQPAGPLGELFAEDLCLCSPPNMSTMSTTAVATVASSHSNGQQC